MSKDQKHRGPMAQVAENFVFFLRKQEDGSRWPVGTKLYADSDVSLIFAQTAAFTYVVERFMRADDDDRVPPTEAEVAEAMHALRAAIVKATGGEQS